MRLFFVVLGVLVAAPAISSAAVDRCVEGNVVVVDTFRSEAKVICSEASLEDLDRHFSRRQRQLPSSTFRTLVVANTTIPRLKIPGSLANQNIREVYMKRIGVSELSPDFRLDFLESLVIFDVSENPLRKLNNLKTCLFHEEHPVLKITYTNLEALDFDLSGCVINHGTFILSHNQITKVDFMVFPSGLDLVDLSDNQISVVVFGRTDAKRINLYNNRITVLGMMSPKVQDLIVDFNEIATVVPTNAKKDLKHLLIRNNNLTEIRAALFRGMEDLEILYLDGNEIETIEDGTFTHLRRLKYLGLSQNNIRRFPKGLFRSLNQLRTLYIWGNPLESIEVEEFFNMVNLRELFVSDEQRVLLNVGRLWEKLIHVNISSTDGLDWKVVPHYVPKFGKVLKTMTDYLMSGGSSAP